jgi:hypothetical protein
MSSFCDAISTKRKRIGLASENPSRQRLAGVGHQLSIGRVGSERSVRFGLLYAHINRWQSGVTHVGELRGSRLDVFDVRGASETEYLLRRYLLSRNTGYPV